MLSTKKERKEKKNNRNEVLVNQATYRGHAFPKETGRNYRRYTTRPITSNCPGVTFGRAPPIARVNESGVNFNSDPVSGHILHIPHPPSSQKEERAALKPTTPTAACVHTRVRGARATLPRPPVPYSLIYHLRSLTAFAFETRRCNADNYETPELPRRAIVVIITVYPLTPSPAEGVGRGQ